MPNPNAAPQDQDLDRLPGQPVQPELELAEILITTRPEVLEMELLMMGGALAISALLEQVDN